jgi:hypothetical protein
MLPCTQSSRHSFHAAATRATYSDEYGRFGAKITLENGPVFAPAEESARQALLRAGAGETTALVGGAIVTVASTPIALEEAALAKAAEKAKQAANWVKGLF